MDPVFKYPASPGTPLHPISPERANIQRTPHQTTSVHWNVQSSPSLPDILSSGNLPERLRSQARTESEVLNKVAKFDSLSKDALDRRRAHEAALKRAVLGREEAEDEVRLARDESRRLRKEIEDGKARERKVGERLEALMEDLQREKETSKKVAAYKKAFQTVQKEAFKRFSTCTQLQEELKDTRQRYRGLQVELEQAKLQTERHEQDAFAARYKIVGVEQELAEVRERVKVVEEERDSLKMTLKEEEVARIAAEGRIALPVSRDGEDRDASPREPTFPLQEQQLPVGAIEEDGSWPIEQQLAWEQAQRLKAEDLVEYMKMECQFKACSCRMAELSGKAYVCDDSAINLMEPILEEMERAHAHTKGSDESVEQQIATEMLRAESRVAFSESTGTFKAFTPARGRSRPDTISTRPAPATTASAPASAVIQDETSLLSLLAAPMMREDSAQPAHPLLPTPCDSRQGTAHQRSRTISHTTTVPLAQVDPPNFLSPRTMSREEAIAQIRQRQQQSHMRSKSVANGTMTPRKPMGKPDERRDISAPAVRGIGRREVS